MKKLVSMILALSVLCISLPFAASAETVQSQDSPTAVITDSYVEYYPDGSSLEVTIKKDVSAPSMSIQSVATTESVQNVSGCKTGTYRDSNGNVMFSFTVYGTYYLDYGNYCYCSSSSYSYSIVDTAWYVTSASSYKSSNFAIGDATFKRKILFIVVDTQNMHLECGCDIYGNIY